MSQKFEIDAELRMDVGKGASRRLRRAGEKIPGIIYGADAPPQNLMISANELGKAMQNEAFFSHVLDIKLEGKVQQAVLRDVQRNPANDKVMHVDLLRVSADRAIEVNVPLHFVDEDKCKGVRLGGGMIAHAMTEVEVSCLPKDLPEYLEVHMAELDVGEIIHLSDLALPPGVTIIALTHDDDRAVVSVQAPRGGSEDEEAGAAPEAAAQGGEGGSGD
ncbi:MAG TPA: 50S ribosomal protein L25/general stress protein Ctc [Pseudomonadales bacterium]